MKTRAAVLYEMEKPTPYAESQPLVVEEVELQGPGPGQALVEIVSAGLCHSDLSVIDGSRTWLQMPMVLGHEAAGVIREVGPNVTDFQPDDHVLFALAPMCGRCKYCAEGRPNLCVKGGLANAEGRLLDGSLRFRDTEGRKLHHHLGISAFSEFTVVAQESLVKIEPDVPLAEAAVFGCAIVTGVGAVINTARVEPGTGVAIFGLGGVGLSTVMGAQLAGAYPLIAIDLLDTKLELAHRLGATHVVNAKDDDPIQAVKDITDGGAHYTFEAVGSEEVLQQAYEAARRGGTTITIGAPHPSRTFSVSALDIVVGERTIKGSYMGSAVPWRDLPRFLALYKAQRLPADLLITDRITLDEINEGFDQLAQGKAVRQIVQFS